MREDWQKLSTQVVSHTEAPSTAKGEHSQAIGSLAISAVQSEWLQTRGHPCSSEASLHHVIKVGMTGKATSAEPAGESMMSQSTDLGAAATAMRLAHLGT